jgi:hypothetical protein
MRAARRLRLLDGRRRRKRDAVLSALASAPGPVSGYRLTRRLLPAGVGLTPRAGRKPDHVYAYLRGLAAAGLVEPAAAGPRGSTLWRATEAGRSVVCGFALRRGSIGVDRTARERVVAAGMAAVLTERQLLVAAWYWFDGHTQRRIADFLGCSRGSVCDRLRLIRYTLAAAGLPEPRRLERPPQ